MIPVTTVLNISSPMRSDTEKRSVRIILVVGWEIYSTVYVAGVDCKLQY